DDGRGGLPRRLVLKPGSRSARRGKRVRSEEPRTKSKRTGKEVGNARRILESWWRPRGARIAGPCVPPGISPGRRFQFLRPAVPAGWKLVVIIDVIGKLDQRGPVRVSGKPGTLVSLRRRR